MPEPPRRTGIWKRLLLGTLLIVVCSGSATAVFAFREVDRVVSALKTGQVLDLGEGLAEAEAGKPQTLLLIGSDKRARTARDARFDKSARSDTLLLVRLDPSRGATALLSLPRDLKVRIPGHGTNKLNAAYAIGGPKLTLETVKELTGLRINHVVNVDFSGFKDAVNAIGCVFVDVDRRYFNDNSGPAQYARIDIRPGYQRLCGRDALDYVRFRHEDNDLVRAARQQEFLRQAKQQVGVSRLISDRERLVDIFGRYTSSDAGLRSRTAVLRLLKLVVASAQQPIREVHFEGRIGASYVTASSAVIRKLTAQFLGVEPTPGPRGGEAATDGSGRRGRRGRRRGRPRQSRPTDGLEDSRAVGRQMALKTRAAGARLPIFYPRVRDSRSVFVGDPVSYRIRVPRRGSFPSYRMVLKRDFVGEYYGIQGTTWPDPPILEGPSERRRIGRQTYELHYDGDRLRLVAWRTPRAVYWLSNTLLQTLSERQMLAIASSARPLR